jgi:alpha-galactosidase
MTGGEAAKAVSLNIAGVQTLDLVVVTAENGINFDHADWAGATVS